MFLPEGKEVASDCSSFKKGRCLMDALQLHLNRENCSRADQLYPNQKSAHQLVKSLSVDQWWE
jgi:hypothetical protein